MSEDTKKDEIHVSEMLNHEVGKVSEWEGVEYVGRVVRREGNELKPVKTGQASWGKIWTAEGGCRIDKEEHPKCKVELIEKSPERTAAEVKTKAVGREAKAV